MVVERKLEHMKKTKLATILEEITFIEKICGNGNSESGGTITQQMRRTGKFSSTGKRVNALPWMPGFYQARYRKFLSSLFDEGLIYRGKRLVNWDPKLHTAISDLEVENTDEEKGFLYGISVTLSPMV